MTGLVNGDFSSPGRWPGEAYGWTVGTQTGGWVLAEYFQADATYHCIEQFWWFKLVDLWSGVSFTVSLFNGELEDRIEQFTDWLESEWISVWSDALAQGQVATEPFAITNYLPGFADAAWTQATIGSGPVETFDWGTVLVLAWNAAWSTAAQFDGISREEFTSATGWTQKEQGLE